MKRSSKRMTDKEPVSYTHLLNPEQVENFKEEAEEEIQLKLDI